MALGSRRAAICRSRGVGFLRGCHSAIVLGSIGVMLALCGPVSAADEKAQPTAGPASADAADKSTAPRVPTLAEIIVAAERSDTLDHDVRKRFLDPAQLRLASEVIRSAEKAIADARLAIRPGTSERSEVVSLIDLAMEVRAYADKVTATANTLEARAQAYDIDLDHIRTIRTQWVMRLEAARQRNAPDDLLHRIEQVPVRLDALARDVTLRRNETLAVLDRASRLRGTMNGVLVESIERRNRLIDALTTARTEPIWQTHRRPEMEGFAATWISGEVSHLSSYLARYWNVLLIAAGITLVLAYGLIVAARRTLAAIDAPDEDTRVAKRMFEMAGPSALLIAMIVTIVHAPDAPVVFYGAALTILFIISAALAIGSLLHKAVLSLCTLAVVLLINWFQAGFDALPYSGRFLLIAQCTIIALALWLDLRRGAFEHDRQLLSAPAMRLLAKLAIALLLVAVIADVFGFLGPARLMRDGVVRTFGFAVFINVLTRLIHSLALALLASRLGRLSRIVAHRADAIRRTLRWALQFCAIGAWLVGSLFSFRALGFLDWLQDTVSDAKIEIGTVTISAEAILQSAGVLLATWIIVKMIRLMLEVELLPRSKISSGTSFVISAATRYILVVAGMVLAMAALGLDLSKITLLISAIGVGIGFGLQNVVNNFVSGVLLLGERVVNIGDTVQVGNLTGVVRRIGVRSTTVRTSQGAEVIVPNGDLTSKDVVNFTLSDRHRRLDIVVGVAYESNPQQVAQALIEAATSCRAVLATPAPVAALVGFGDSTLNFRLQAWIGNYEEGLSTETALRIAILSRFEAEGIEMPFPQHDLHLHGAPELAISQS